MVWDLYTLLTLPLTLILDYGWFWLFPAYLVEDGSASFLIYHSGPPTRCGKDDWGYFYSGRAFAFFSWGNHRSLEYIPKMSIVFSGGQWGPPSFGLLLDHFTDGLKLYHTEVSSVLASRLWLGGCFGWDKYL